MRDIHDPNYELKDIRTKIERLYAPYPRNMRFVGDPPPKPDRRLRFVDDPLNLDRRNALIDEFIAATRAEIYERDAGRAGSYSAKYDAIRMPAFEFFHGQIDEAVLRLHRCGIAGALVARWYNQPASRSFCAADCGRVA